MVYDFDVRDFCQNLKATKPPYECPVKDCGKVYKSYCGIQFHLYNYDHDNPENNSPTPTGKKPGKKKGRWGHHRSMRRSPTPPDFIKPAPRLETLTYAEAQRLVEIDVDGRIHRINIYEPLEIMEKEEKAEKVSKVSKQHVEKNKTKNKEPSVQGNTNNNKDGKLPEAQFKVVEDYIKPCNPKPRPNSYYRYIEKSVEELDDEVEYDMDEEV